MADLAVIRDVLARAARRWRVHRALGGLWTGLLAGTLVWFLLLAIHKLAPIPPGLVQPAWVLPLVGAVAGALARGMRRIPEAIAARLLEHRAGLDPQLSTAVELAAKEPDSPWTREVAHHAAQSARNLRLAQVLPLHLGRAARAIPLALAGIISLAFVPEYRSDAYLRARRDAALIRETGRKVVGLVQHQIARQSALPDPVEDALRGVGMAGEQLAGARLTRAEALTSLASTTRRLEEAARQLDLHPALQRIRQAARTPAPDAPGGMDDLRRQLERLKSGHPEGAQEVLDQLARHLAQASQATQGLRGSPGDASAQQSLAQTLQSALQSANLAGLDLPSLQNAAQALQELDIDRVLQELRDASADLEQLRDLARNDADGSEHGSEPGGNLAEQLARGQAGIAATTLDDMGRQLRQANLSPEDLARLARELANALEPSTQYGDVRQRLAAAGDNLGQGRREDAAQQLTQAADALRQLSSMAQDLDHLAQTLESLRQAQSSLASGRSWSPASGPPKAGSGGQPGRGVGTWADENPWLFYPERSDRWDNSGLERPDTTPRGGEDRGEGQQAENLAPTRLEGAFRPGSMPSIQLRGIHTQGRSTVAYEQAVEAAQAEAQSALNQDQVPRAYRNAVRGYFDDLN